MFTKFQLNHTILQVCRIQFPHSSQASQCYQGLIDSKALDVTEVLVAVDHVRHRMDSICVCVHVRVCGGRWGARTRWTTIYIKCVCACLHLCVCAYAHSMLVAVFSQKVR